MPYNADFEIPATKAIPRPLKDAPLGSYFCGVFAPGGLIAWRPGREGTTPKRFVLEWTCYEAFPFDQYEGEELGLIFEQPVFHVQPNTAYPISDVGARGPGDLITNGDVIAMVAGPPGEQVAYNVRAGTSSAPLVGYKGWRMFIDGQHIFTKLP